MSVATKKKAGDTPAKWGGRRGGPAVAFEMVDLGEVLVPFDEKKRHSPYRDAINKLILADSEKALRFESVSCRSSIAAAAKKMGVPVLFAEQSGNLFVRLRKKCTSAELLLEIILEKPWSKADLIEMVRSRGLQIDVTAEIETLRNNDLIKLDGAKWMATQKARSAV